MAAQKQETDLVMELETATETHWNKQPAVAMLALIGKLYFFNKYFLNFTVGFTKFSL